MVVAASASAGEVPLNAKQIVVDFFRLALLEGQVDKAFDQYVGDTYIGARYGVTEFFEIRTRA
jgi:predicted SnoaL-like aldol condensation-catalyzing enzyme